MSWAKSGTQLDGKGRDAVVKQRLSWVDTARGLAIVLVVIFHTRNWVAITGVDTQFWTDFSTVMATLRMPLFFVLSGLFAAKWVTAPWRQLLHSKVLLFIWVLWVWSAIGVPIQVAAIAATGQPVGISTAVKTVIFAPIDPPFELWFIWALAVFFVLAKLTSRVPVIAQLIVAALVSAFALTVWLNTTNGLTGSLKFFFFFLAGLHLKRIVAGVANVRWELRLGMVLGWAGVSAAVFVMDLRDVPGIYFVNCLAGVVGGIALSTFLVPISVLGRLGRQTLPIYLAHTPIAILITLVILYVPGMAAGASSISPVVVPLVAGIAIVLALMLRSVSRASPLRNLYEPPSRLAALVGGK